MKIKEGFQVTQSENGFFVARATGAMAEEYPDAIQMGLSGAFLWDALTKEDCSRAELIFKLGYFYEMDVDMNKITADVDTFVSFLRQEGLLINEA